MAHTLLALSDPDTAVPDEEDEDAFDDQDDRTHADETPDRAPRVDPCR